MARVLNLQVALRRVVQPTYQGATEAVRKEAQGTHPVASQVAVQEVVHKTHWSACSTLREADDSQNHLAELVEHEAREVADSSASLVAFPMAPEAAGIPAILTDQEVTRADLPANLVAFQEVFLLTSRLAIQVAVQEAVATAHRAQVGGQEAT